MALYKNYKSSDIKNAQAGYGANAILTPLSHFDELKQPVVSATPVLGEAKTIATSHTYLAGKTGYEVYCVPKTTEAPGELVGEELAKRFLWKPKIIIAGDSAELLDMAMNMLSDSFILHFEDSRKCENGGGYIQFGSKCNPATIVAGSFTSGTGTDGRKQYEFELETTDKYFYTGALTTAE